MGRGDSLPPALPQRGQLEPPSPGWVLGAQLGPLSGSCLDLPCYSRGCLSLKPFPRPAGQCLMKDPQRLWFSPTSQVLSWGLWREVPVETAHPAPFRPMDSMVGPAEQSVPVITAPGGSLIAS